MRSPSDLLDLSDLPGPDLEAGKMLRERAATVLRPSGALSRLDEIAVWLGEWQRTPRPSTTLASALIFAADHGVAIEGVSAYPASITGDMVEALDKGSATAAVLAKTRSVDLRVIDVGVGAPTGNIAVEPAMGPDRFQSALRAGIEAVAGVDTGLLILGEMGIGNTTAAAAVACSLYGGEAAVWVGPGTGLDPEGLAMKRSVVQRAVDRVGSVAPFEVLRQLGGTEMVALVGAALQARRRSIPVILDGMVVTSALMTLEAARPGALDHCWPGHLSPEPGHGRLLERLGRLPLLDLSLRLGEGSGALIALSIVELAVAAVTEVATFGEWGIS